MPNLTKLQTDDLNTFNNKQKLTKALTHTQVFGGMDSWLDSPPFNAEEHQKASYTAA